MKFPCLNSFTIDLHMWTPLESWDVYIVLRESSLVAGGVVHDGSIPIDKSMNFPVGASPSDFLVINPVNGFTFSAADPNCPLQEIACLATTTNVFANVQQGNLLLIYICIFHILSHLLLIYICKLHWNFFRWPPLQDEFRYEKQLTLETFFRSSVSHATNRYIDYDISGIYVCKSEQNDL